jgi:hypothetical protein
MRKFLRLGDGVPFTTITLLVLGPVLLGLVLIVFYPVFDASWWSDLMRNPAKHAILIFCLLVVLRAVVRPSLDSEDDDRQEDRRWTGLARTAEMLWAMAGGMLICLGIVVDKATADTSNHDIAVYIAVGLVLLSIALGWRDQRERSGFDRQAG